MRPYVRFRLQTSNFKLLTSTRYTNPVMTITGLSITRLTPVLGAEIHGIDLDTIDEDGLRQVHDALVAHQVVFFRDQDISVESQMRLGAHFGELVAHPNDPGLEGHPEVMIIHADESSKRVAGESWHSDVSCDSEPPMGRSCASIPCLRPAATRCSPACTPRSKHSQRRYSAFSKA